MRRTDLLLLVILVGALFTSAGLAFQTTTDGPYKVLKTAKVGGEGGTDYIFADTAGRRLYIARGATQAQPATDTRPAVPAFEKRLTIFDLDTLAPVGTIPGVGGNGATVCPKTGHGFTSDHPQPSMFDVKTMKVTKTYPFGDNGGCNGLALDAKNQILFAACSAVGSAPPRGTPPPAPDPNAKPPQTFVILSAKDGKILARLPLAGSSDGATFNPATKEAFSTQGNGTMTIVKEKSPTTFEVEENLKTWPSNGARTIAFDGKTGHLFAMASEPAMPPPAPPAGTTA